VYVCMPMCVHAHTLVYVPFMKSAIIGRGQRSWRLCKRVLLMCVFMRVCVCVLHAGQEMMPGASFTAREASVSFFRQLLLNGLVRRREGMRRGVWGLH